MRDRKEADIFIRNIVNGDAKVYFQPPESTRLEYPCIIYNMQNELGMRADNTKYLHKMGYTMMLIDKNPDSELFKRFISNEKFSFDRKYQTNNLNHWVFMFYY